MTMKYKILKLATLISTTTGNVLAHGGEDTAGTSGMMMDGSMMHNAGHMTGYNLWGMGWVGLLMGLTFWTLLILGIIYLVKEITKEEGEDKNEA